MTKILLVATLFLISTFTIANVDTILNKTWFSESGIAGHQYVFFQAESGKFKAIKQILGSGICLIKSEIYDLEIKEDSLILDNGRDLISGASTTTPNLVFDRKKIEIREGEFQMRPLGEVPVIFNWATDEFCDEIDFNGLLKINIQSNEIYSSESIRELRIKRRR